MSKSNDPATTLASVAVLSIEESGDYYHKPEAVVITDKEGNTMIYCQDARYNFIQAALHKNAIRTIVDKGAIFRGHHLEAKYVDHDEFHENNPFGDFHRHDVLNTLFQRNPRQYWFLEKYISQ